MNYKFFQDTESKQFITNFNKEPELRPQVNDIVTFPPNKIKWVITREEKNPIPTTDPTTFDYFVRPQDTSYDTVSLRGSNDNVIRQLFQM